MSLVINGELREDWLAEEQQDGEFVRQESQFRHWVTPDGAPGPSGEGGFAAESGRYHLYISLACPWAHRTLIFRKLKGLEEHIGLSVVHPHMGPKGWHFDDSFPGATKDAVHGADYMYEVYLQAKPDYTGIVTVPVLWDKQRETIVNNESSEIIRMFNSAFDALTDQAALDFYPEALHAGINAVNAEVYENVNNGVYRCGFAGDQDAYERAFDCLFATLDTLEHWLGGRRYLAGEQLTEADWRLFTTLVRFDAVYYVHFKCNLRRIADYPNLYGYLRELYQYPGVRETVDFNHIKQHYYWSHPELNPTRLVPKGPLLELDAPHGREAMDEVSG